MTVVLSWDGEVLHGRKVYMRLEGRGAEESYHHVWLQKFTEHQLFKSWPCLFKSWFCLLKTLYAMEKTQQMWEYECQDHYLQRREIKKEETLISYILLRKEEWQQKQALWTVRRSWTNRKGTASSAPHRLSTPQFPQAQKKNLDVGLGNVNRNMIVNSGC